jgi:putative FmdB family regulatory protein
MPTYQYVCTKCGHEFEVFQPITADALETCPKEQCPRKRWGRGKVKRVLSGGAGLIFKGSGFYATDYRSESYRQAAKRESESGQSKSNGEGAKSSGKSGAKSDAAGGKASGSGGGKSKD